MASFTFTTEVIPVGASVSAYPNSAFPPASGPPPGPAAATTTVASNSTVTFTGLVAGQQYIAYSGPPDHYVHFAVPSVPAGGGSGIPSGGNTGQILTKGSPLDGDAGWSDPDVSQAELDAVSTVAVTGTSAGGAKAWTASTAFAKNQVVSFSGGNYLCTTAHTSGSTFDASKFAALNVSAAATMLGQTGGQVIGSGAVPPGLSGELWAVANFTAGAGRNSSTLTPSLTANGTGQTLDTIVHFPNISPSDTSWRLLFTPTSVPSNGWWGVSAAFVDNAGAILTNSNEQWLVGYNTADPLAPVVFDFKVNKAWAAAGTSFNLRLRLQTVSNSTAGTLALSSVSVQQTGYPQRSILFAFVASVGPSVMQRVFDPVARTFKMAQTIISGEGTITSSPQNIQGWPREMPFTAAQADPDFVSSATSIGTGVGNSGQGGQTDYRLMRLNNNDQIIQVKDSDGTWELRGNTHGGESDRPGSPIFQYDVGDGTWVAWSSGAAPANTTANGMLRSCRRFQLKFNTKLVRTTPGDTVANVDHTVTYFPDGMQRMDRTTTWQQATEVGVVFEWMSSHDTSTPKVGRVGTGFQVLENVDIFPKVATPAAPAVVASGTGSSLTAGTYYYGVTALAEGGETALSPRTSVATTLAQSNAVSWSSVTGATGYRVYGRSSQYGPLSLLATVAPGTTSWTDDGTAVMLGVQPPAVNQARHLNAASIVTDTASTERGVWAVWYDPIVNLCFGNIYDRDALSGRTSVAGTSLRLQGVAGSIVKNYLNLWWRQGDPGVSLNYTADQKPSISRTVPLNEVWSATHWSFVYAPADPANYHLEIAARSIDLTALKSMYPST